MKKRHSVSLLHALEGLLHALISQPNFIVHIVLSTLAVACGILFAISQFEWTILTLTIAVGLSIELINTSIESVVDLVTQEWKAEAKVAKDTSAAAMLVFSVGALIIAMMIFIPKVFAQFTI